ncbi:MAG: phosphatidate cytidylyltransferase [Bacillota bacterium]
MLKDRVISGVLGAPVVLLLTWLGGWPLACLVGAISLAGVWELVGLFERRGVRARRALAMGASAAIIAGATGRDFTVQGIVLAVVTLVAMGIEVFQDSTNIGAPLVTVFCVIYVPFLLSFLLRLRTLSAVYALLVVLCTWATDTAAYFVGIRFGKRRVLPNISPRKSVEGAVGGVVAAVVTAMVVAHVAGIPYSSLLAALLGGLIGVGAELGDLAESAIKRFCGAKDSGQIIPGHGGVLDRFDSMIFSAPVAYIVLQLLTGYLVP